MDCFLQGEVAGFPNTLIVTLHKAEVTVSVQREHVIICSSICNISWTLILTSIAQCLNFPQYGLCNSLCGFSYALHYVILVLILLMLRQHEVFHASAYMIQTAYCRNISTNLGIPCLYRSALYWHWYRRAFACAPCSLGVVLFPCTRVCGGSSIWSWCRWGLFLTPSVVLFTCHFITFTHTPLALFRYFLCQTRRFVSGFFSSALVPVCFSI